VVRRDAAVDLRGEMVGEDFLDLAESFLGDPIILDFWLMLAKAARLSTTASSNHLGGFVGGSPANYFARAC